ncbi:MAG TPA: hypothetical protein VHE80_10430 [Acidimicrobiales bacterium]|nr:hypothetical protein [Acidimicrobiales bacterium]
MDEAALVRVTVPPKEGPRVARSLAARGLYPSELRPGGDTLEEALPPS